MLNKTVLNTDIKILSKNCLEKNMMKKKNMNEYVLKKISVLQAKINKLTFYEHIYIIHRYYFLLLQKIEFSDYKFI